MKELRDIVRAWRDAPDGAQLVLATVIDIKGSTYRRPGAHLLVVDGAPYGSISGGCLESDLVSTAWERTEDGPVVAVFDTTSQEDAVFGYGLGCRGIVTVFLRRVAKDDLQLTALEAHLEGRETSRFETQIDGPEAGAVSIRAPSGLRNELLGEEGDRRFVEEIEPVLNLHIYGAGFDALPLARIASELGWFTYVYDHRPAHADGRRFPALCQVSCVQFKDLTLATDPYCAHVVMTHNFEKDKEILERILPRGYSYLGVLGPRARTCQLLSAAGHPDAEGVRTPVGLDIGAETPEEIALAIAAEIQAVLRSRRGGFLKDRPQRIHQEAVLG